VGATYCIIDNCMLLGHDAERHDPNTAMMASKVAGKPDLIYFNNNIEPCSKITNVINEIFFYFVQEREAAPSGLALLLVGMSFGGHFDRPMPIVIHWPIGQVLPYQWMRGNWDGLAKNAAKTNSSW
jgi:hypothetical protein